MSELPEGDAHITALVVSQDAYEGIPGRTHIFGIFDTMEVPKCPYTVGFKVFCRVQGEGVHTAYVRIINPLGDKIIDTEATTFEVNLEKSFQLFLAFGITLEMAGLYKVQAFLDRAPQIEVPFVIRQNTPLKRPLDEELISPY